MKAYKFRSASQIAYAFDIIINRRLFCSTWEKLNDPMEGIFVSVRKDTEEIEAKQRVKKIIEAQKKYKICSLAGTFDSHLLWAHYAGGFDGVAIEIELPESNNIKKVNYRDVFSYVNIDNLTNEEATAKKILFSKYSEWKYEEEVRILNNSEWYNLQSPPSQVIAGHRMPSALFEVLNITCTSLGIPFKRIGIGDEGLDADYVKPPSENIPNNVFKQTLPTSHD